LVITNCFIYFQITVIEDYLSSLQIHISAVNQSIESCSNSIIGLMPTITNESLKLAHQAEQLKAKLTTLEKEIKSESIGFDHERLDNLKRNLENAKSFLEQSDSFTRITNEMEELLENESSNIIEICDKLQSLRKLTQTQLIAAGNSERESQVEDFTNRVEEVLTRKAFSVLTENNIDELCRYIDIFTKIDRLQSIKNIYINFQRETCTRKWHQISENFENQSNLLNEFYNYLLNEWEVQVKLFSQYFNTNGVCDIIFMFIETLSGLKTERESLLGSILKSSDEKFEILLSFSESNLKFAEELKEKVINTQVLVPQFLMEKLAQSVFEYFNIYIQQYISIEQSFLNTHLNEMNFMQTNFNDTVRLLESCVLKTFQTANEVLDRQLKITDSCSIINIISILNSFFNSVLTKIKKSQTQLENCLKDQSVNLQSCISSLNIFGVFKSELDKIELKIKKLLAEKSAKEIDKRYFFGYNFVRQSDLNEFHKLTDLISQNSLSLDIFVNLGTPIEQQCKAAHQTILSLIFMPIEGFLSNIKIDADSTYSSDLPQFSLTQNEYITGIGQYLLTLPQNLEPLLLQPSDSLKIALEISDQSYKENIPSADILLALVADETCIALKEKILEMTSLNEMQSRLLSADIDYYQSILDELGLKISTDLKKISQLMKFKSETFIQDAAEVDDSRIVAAVRQIRNISVLNG
jgi:conserved oligomeric Golgi complex subunit 7